MSAVILNIQYKAKFITLWRRTYFGQDHQLETVVYSKKYYTVLLWVVVPYLSANICKHCKMILNIHRPFQSCTFLHVPLKLFNTGSFAMWMILQWLIHSYCYLRFSNITLFTFVVVSEYCQQEPFTRMWIVEGCGAEANITAGGGWFVKTFLSHLSVFSLHC